MRGAVSDAKARQPHHCCALEAKQGCVLKLDQNAAQTQCQCIRKAAPMLHLARDGFYNARQLVVCVGRRHSACGDA